MQTPGADDPGARGDRYDERRSCLRCHRPRIPYPGLSGNTASPPFTSGRCARTRTPLSSGASSCPRWERRQAPGSPQPVTWTPCTPLWRCWSRKPRTAGRGASSASDEHPGCPSARHGTPSSTTGCRWRSDSSSSSWPMGASSREASMSWLSDCPAPARPTPCVP